MHKIKQIKKDLGLTQRQLAAELGLAKNGDVYIRKVYAKHSSKLNQIDRRLNAIDDHIFELCELIK